LSAGRWRTIYPGVYFLGAGKISWKARLAAACLWAGDGSVVSHLAAAQLHGLIADRNPVAITVPHKKNSAHGIEIHWDPSGPGRRATLDGIPVTSVERTLADVCRTAKRTFAVEIVERAIRGKHTNLRRLIRSLEAPDTKPCRTLGWVLENRFAYGVTDSEAENLYIRLARKHDLHRGMVHHYVVQRNGQHLGELDFAYTAELLNVEIDGDESHADPVAAQRDKRRDALLGEMGWTVLRFTYWQLVREPDWVADRVRAVLERCRETSIQQRFHG
jgi:very-short-patch-repair endonuclease